MVDLMVKPPAEGDASYEQYQAEFSGIFASLGRRAERLSKALNSMTNVTCTVVQGSMYAFPQVRLPPAAVEAAKAAGKEPGTFYCLEMLAQTGVCVVPGSGFRQVEGTQHFRTTFLPPEDKMDTVMSRIKVFNDNFMSKYA